jgi:hypothetical protein
MLPAMENGWPVSILFSRPTTTSATAVQRGPQQVTWSNPITAPSAWFQTGITAGVDSSSTWQRFRAK